MFRKLLLNVRSFFRQSGDVIARGSVNRWTEPRSQMPYRSRSSLLTKGELAFFEELRLAVGNRYMISLKTRVADVVHCPDSHWKSAYGRRVASTHIDFLLYDKRSAEVVLAIELDDRSHLSDKRKERDDFLDEALRSAHIPLLRLRCDSKYDAADILAWIEEAISLG